LFSLFDFEAGFEIVVDSQIVILIDVDGLQFEIGFGGDEAGYFVELFAFEVAHVPNL
jgi:hypothetical protein